MSIEADLTSPETELKELVTQALEENGLLSKLRAQLRAGLYIALENEINDLSKNYADNTLKFNLENSKIRSAFCLVLEFLEYFNLRLTKSVFEKESLLGILYDYKGKERLIADLEIGLDNHSESPLLVELLNIAEHKYTVGNDFVNKSPEVFNATFDVQCVNSENVQYVGTKADDHKTNLTYLEEVSSESIQSTSNDFSNSDIADIQEESSLADNSDVDIPLTDFDKLTKSFSVKTTSATNKCVSPKSFVSSERKRCNKTNPTMRQDFVDSLLTNKSPENRKYDKVTKNKSDLSNLDENQIVKTRFNSDFVEKKCEKPKLMSGLNSLGDLASIQVAKTRSPDTVLLPSLYSKEFREKSNSKDFDKILDLNFSSIDNYEEDDILSTTIDYGKHTNILLKSDIKVDSKSVNPIKLFDSNIKKTNDVHENFSNIVQQSVNSQTSVCENKKNNSETKDDKL